MAEMSRRFNFDDFQEQIDEALERNEEAMVDVLPTRQPRPGEIGGVAITNVIDLNANVFDLQPPDDAA